MIPIADIDDVKAAGFGEFDEQKDDVITLALEAATEEIQKMVAPRVIVFDDVAADIVENHSGSMAVKNRTELWLNVWPIISITSITENGLTLTSGEGFDSTGLIDVLVDKERGKLLRRPTSSLTRVPGLSFDGHSRPWVDGLQNITITYKGGFHPSLAGAERVPRNLRAYAAQLALLILEEFKHVGSANVGRQSGSTGFSDKLPDHVNAGIMSYAPHGRPRTR